MKKLDNTELVMVSGGAVSAAIKMLGVGLAAAGVFIASVIYGYINPNKCNR